MSSAAAISKIRAAIPSVQLSMVTTSTATLASSSSKVSAAAAAADATATATATSNAATAVDFLSTPSDYIATLRALCRTASRRITLSALYLGNKNHEVQ